MRQPLTAVLLGLAAAAGVSPRLAARAATRTSRLQCAEPVPVPFRPLSQQDVLDKLDAVPVFSVVGGGREMFPTQTADDALICCFHLDVVTAQRALAELQTANPGVPLSLAVTPLGTAYALCEWSGATNEAAQLGSDRRGVGNFASGRVWGGADSLKEAPARAPSSEEGVEIQMRIVANVGEVAAVEEIMEQSPTPALLRRANQVKGPVPLFGSDELRFVTRAAGAAADGEEEGSAQTLTPLFLSRSDFRSGWLASGGSDETLPTAQVSDLRTLTWQMEHESAFNWRSVVLVAPQDSIDFAMAHELMGYVAAQRVAKGAQPPLPPPLPPPRMKRGELQRAIFPGA